MTAAVATVIADRLQLPALFAPDPDAARRFIEFFTCAPQKLGPTSCCNFFEPVFMVQSDGP